MVFSTVPLSGGLDLAYIRDCLQRDECTRRNYGNILYYRASNKGDVPTIRPMEVRGAHFARARRRAGCEESVP